MNDQTIPPRTSICGYCHTEHPSGQSCTCPDRQAALQARQDALDARYNLQRLGIASNETGQTRAARS